MYKNLLKKMYKKKTRHSSSTLVNSHGVRVQQGYERKGNGKHFLVEQINPLLWNFSQLLFRFNNVFSNSIYFRFMGKNHP